MSNMPAYYEALNTYNGVTSLQMKVEDIVPTESTEK